LTQLLVRQLLSRSPFYSFSFLWLMFETTQIGVIKTSCNLRSNVVLFIEFYTVFTVRYAISGMQHYITPLITVYGTKLVNYMVLVPVTFSREH
jgi:hypothetical protein